MGFWDYVLLGWGVPRLCWGGIWEFYDLSWKVAIGLWFWTHSWCQIPSSGWISSEANSSFAKAFWWTSRWFPGITGLSFSCSFSSAYLDYSFSFSIYLLACFIFTVSLLCCRIFKLPQWRDLSKKLVFLLWLFLIKTQSIIHMLWNSFKALMLRYSGLIFICYAVVLNTYISMNYIVYPMSMLTFVVKVIIY